MFDVAKNEDDDLRLRAESRAVRGGDAADQQRGNGKGLSDRENRGE